MAAEQASADAKKRHVSKVKLALGAAGLFLFIVGVKRSFRLDEQREVSDATPPSAAPPAA